MFDSIMNLKKFWYRGADSHIKIGEIALRYLLVSSITYLCELGFSCLFIIINK